MAQYRMTKKLMYGQSVDTDTSDFADLFQGAGGAAANKIFDLQDITIKNIGTTAVELDYILESWTSGAPDTQSATRYLKQLLPVGKHLYLPTLRLVDYSTSLSAGKAYLLDNKNPADIDSGALYQASGSTLGAHLDSPDTTVTVNASTHPFYVGDIIQVGTDTVTAQRQEMMRVTKVDGATLHVDRALYGTTAADKDAQTDATDGAVSGARIFLPFFNITANSNQYGGLATCQTDDNGVFHIMNFFGYGRATSHVAGGIVPGSFAAKYFNPGYQELGLRGVTSSTNTGLAVSTEYGFDITADGSGLLTSDYMKFTTDSSNVNWGGTNGVLSKMQTALDTQYYTTGSAIAGEKVTVGIVGGDIRFTSGQNLSTSAILLAAPSAGETTPFGVGRIPAIGSVNAPVAARLPDDIVYDKMSGVESSNESVYFHDDGNGNISGAKTTGYLNYSTGELYFKGSPNSHFVFSATYGSALSGGTRLTTGAGNSISNIGARSLNHKVSGLIEITATEP
tara:strand:+ start:1703 stop:3229 length:1527 start_codon:yes stop_codon:yes gene_type:complete